MKKIISLLITGALLSASAVMPVFADYTESNYDKVDQDLTFDDGSVENPIDGSQAKELSATGERVMTTSLNTTQEFFLSFDFSFTSDAGDIEIPKFKSDGITADKVGPILTTSGGQLRTNTASSSYQQLGEFVVGDWYTGEIEGKTGMGAAYTTFRLYKYVDGAKTLVQETKNFNCRNLSSNNLSFTGLKGMNAYIDNIKLISEKPDTITLSAIYDEEMNAGSDNAFEYVMSRQEVEFTKYDVVWSLYNEDNTAPLEDENITISSNGILSAGINSESKTVTVRATAEFNGEELYGSKQIKINAVDIDSEKFDSIIVDGSDSAQIGIGGEYTYTATKDGIDVTESLTDDDVVWSIYDATGIVPNGNKYISVENGALRIDDSVVAQNITVRAASVSGKVYGNKSVSILWSESQKEPVLEVSACEEALTNTELVESWDDSKALLTGDAVTYSFGDQSVYTVMDVDMKFTNNNGTGFTFYNNNGSENSNIRINNGAMSQQTGGSKWDPIISADDMDFDAWYHIEFLYLNGAESGYNVYKYDAEGNKTMVAQKANCNRRNDKPFGKVVFTANVTIDNIKIATASANEVTLSAPGQYIFAGETAQFTATASRNGLNFASATGLTWSVLDSQDLPIIDESVTISDSGVLNVTAMAKPETINVVVTSASGESARQPITIQSKDVFKITNIGVNEDKTKITKLFVEKAFYYDDDVTFVVAIKDANGVLKGVTFVHSFGDRIALGSNEITVDYTLPANFDSENDSIETMVWTLF